MKNFPDDLLYSREHIWVRVEGKQATIGISDYAQEQLGDIVFLELPEDGTDIKKDQTFGSIESVKTVSDLYAPISGEVIEINEPLIDSPELINEDPYGDGWLIRIELSDSLELEELLEPDEYEEYLSEIKEEEDLGEEDEDEEDEDDDL